MKYPTKVIKIEAISNKEDSPKFSIKGDDGNWYSGFKEWQGERKTGYLQLLSGNHNEPFQKGDYAKISYQIGEYNGQPQYGLLSMFPADPSQTPPKTETPRSEANNASSVKSESFWERQAYEKCCSLWAAAVIQHNPDSDPIIGIENGQFWKLFQAIKADGDKRFSPLRQAVTKHVPRVIAPEEEPPIESYDEPSPVDPESIPF
jgi:hypothetical protein